MARIRPHAPQTTRSRPNPTHWCCTSLLTQFYHPSTLPVMLRLLRSWCARACARKHPNSQKSIVWTGRPVPTREQGHEVQGSWRPGRQRWAQLRAQRLRGGSMRMQAPGPFLPLRPRRRSGSYSCGGWDTSPENTRRASGGGPPPAARLPAEGAAPQAGSSPAAIRLQARATGKAPYFWTVSQAQERMKYGVTLHTRPAEPKSDVAHAGA